MHVAPISPIWGSFNPLFARRVPKLAHFSSADLADYIDTPTTVGTGYLRSLFTIRFYMKPATWTPAADRLIFAFGNNATSNWSIYCAHNSIGQVYAIYSKNGSSNNGGDVSSSDLGLADNVGCHIAISRYSTSGVGKIYKSLDGVSWTDITQDNSAVTGALYNTSSTFKIGGGFSGYGYGFEGYLGKLQSVPDDEAPTNPVFSMNFDPSIYSTGTSFACPTTYGTAQPQTWTLRGNASIVGPLL